MTWTHFSDTRPRASKQYRCELCGLRIRKGARHVARRGADSDYGGVFTARMHEVCESKTKGWGYDDWEVVGGCESEFRVYELGLKQ